MSLQVRLGALITAIGADIKSLQTGGAAQRGAFSGRSTAAAQLGSAAADAKVLLATEEYDPEGWFASSRFTPQYAGYYQINGGVISAGSLGAGAFSFCAIRKNGAALSGGQGQSATVTQGTNISGYVYLTTSSVVYLNGTTDYIELWGSARTSANAQLTAVSFNSWMNGIRL